MVYIAILCGESRGLHANFTLQHLPTVFGLRPQYVLPKWEMSRRFVHNCRRGVFQYVFIKVALTIITLILVEQDKYANGNLSPK